VRTAIVTQHYSASGGVPAIARWLREGLTHVGHDVQVHDLVTSSRDQRSRRLLAPRSWWREPSARVSSTDPDLFHWGANWVEFESRRYRPRSELTRALNEYDLIQVVSGGPALALAVSEATPPKALQVATTLLMERRAHLPEFGPVKRIMKTADLRSLHRLEVKALRAVDHVFVENRWMEQWVREQGQPQVTFAPPGIDVDLFKPVGEWDPTRPIIAFGRLGDSRKDWPTAVAAYERFVAGTGLDNRLLLAGEGPLAAGLVAKLASSPVRDRITMRENVPAAELPGLLASGSVFLQSSLEEGLGLAGLEAMACGLPVVATRTVGSAEYVKDGVNGYLVDLSDGKVDVLASRLKDVLASNRNGAMAEGAISTVRNGFSSGSALKRFLSVYDGMA